MVAAGKSGLSQTITSAIGDQWITDLNQLSRLNPLAADVRFRQASRNVKREAKSQFGNWLERSAGQIVDPDTIFDCHVKRIHEYKRQLLMALRIVVLYNPAPRKPKHRDVPQNVLLRRQSCARLSVR